MSRVTVAEARQLHEREKLFDARVDLGARHFADAQTETDVVMHGHVVEERIALERETDAARAGRRGGAIDAVDLDAPFVRFLEPGDQAKDGRFAGTRWAEQRGNAPGGGREADAGGGRGLPLLAEALAQIANDDAHRASVGVAGKAKATFGPAAGALRFLGLPVRSTIFFRISVATARSVKSEATAKAPTKRYSL